MTSAFPRKLLVAGAAVLALPALGTVAYAAAHAVSNNPAPQRVVPIDSRSRVDDTTETTDSTEVRGREAEAGDDRGGDERDDTVVTAPGTTVTTARGNDDGPNHDIGDDHGGDTNTTVTVDDNSGSGSANSGSGSANSGSGSDDSGHGSDDSGHHGGDD
jgi:hypothetical protein